MMLEQTAVPVVMVTVWQEAIGVPLSVKLTDPEGAGVALELTVAVKLTLSLTLEDVGSLEASVNVTPDLFTVCGSAGVEVAPL